MKKWLLLLLLGLCLPFTGYGSAIWKKTVDNQFSAEVTLSSRQISLQEELEVQLLLKFPSNYHVEIERLTANLLNHSALNVPNFRLISVKNELKPSNDHSMELIFRLDPLIEGKKTLSFFNIDFIGNDQEKDKIVTIISALFDVEISSGNLERDVWPKLQPLMTFSESLPIEIDESNRKNLIESISSTDREAIKNVKILKEKSISWGRMLIMMILGGLLFIFRKQLIDLLQAPPLPKNSIEERQKILIEIDALNQQNPPKFYADLSNILRKFIEDQYHLMTSGCTSQEFLKKIAEIPLDKHLQAVLADFLLQADDVKFAKHIPSSEECQQALKTAKSIVLA